MSQFTQTYLLSQEQLEHYSSKAILEGELLLPDDSLELRSTLPYSGDARPLMALEAMMDETVEDDSELFSYSPYIHDLREQEVPVFLAIHHKDVANVERALTELEQIPDDLTAYYTEFYGWDDGSEGMRETVTFLKAAITQLSAQQCWLLIFVL